MSKACMECVHIRPDDGFCKEKKKLVGAFEVHDDCFTPKEQKTEFIEVQEPKQRCKVCGRELPMSAFQKNKKSKSGHLFTCKECMSKKISKSVNSAKTETPLGLDCYTDREMVEELRKRGWDVKCTKVTVIEL